MKKRGRIGLRWIGFCLLIGASACFAQQRQAHLITYGSHFYLTGKPLGIASDGSNCIALVHSNLGPYFQLIEPRIDGGTLRDHGTQSFPSGGGASQIAWGNGRWLAAWANTNNASSTVEIAFWRGDGLILAEETNHCEVTEVSFDGDQFLVLWQTLTPDGSSRICGRFVDWNGQPQSWLTIQSAPVAQRRFAAASSVGLRPLVVWLEKETESSEWNLVGGFSDRSGSITPSQLNETRSQTASPIDVAHDGTDFLVVWSREAESPFTNISYLALFGLRLDSNGAQIGNEFQISRSNGQIAPSLVYNGEHYCLAWADKRFYTTNWGTHTLHCQVLSRTGEMLETETPRIAFCVPGTPLAMVAGTYVVLTHYVGQRPTDGHGYVGYYLDEPLVVSPLLENPTAWTNNTVKFNLVSAVSNSYVIQWTTNLVNWSIVEGIWGRRAFWPGEVVLDRFSTTCVYRAIDHKYTCIRNLRRVEVAHRLWTLDHGKSFGDLPPLPDLFGPAKYFEELPVCPGGGTYRLNPGGAYPTCTLGAAWGHSVTVP